MARSTCLVMLIKKKYPLWGGIIISLLTKKIRDLAKDICKKSNLAQDLITDIISHTVNYEVT